MFKTVKVNGGQAGFTPSLSFLSLSLSLFLCMCVCHKDFLQPEAVFLVVCDPSVNEL